MPDSWKCWFFFIFIWIVFCIRFQFKLATRIRLDFLTNKTLKSFNFNIICSLISEYNFYEQTKSLSDLNFKLKLQFFVFHIFFNGHVCELAGNNLQHKIFYFSFSLSECCRYFMQSNGTWLFIHYKNKMKAKMMVDFMCKSLSEWVFYIVSFFPPFFFSGGNVYMLCVPCFLRSSWLFLCFCFKIIYSQFPFAFILLIYVFNVFFFGKKSCSHFEVFSRVAFYLMIMFLTSLSKTCELVEEFAFGTIFC